MPLRILEGRKIQRIPFVRTVVRGVLSVPFVVEIVWPVEKARLATGGSGGYRLAIHLNLPARAPSCSPWIVDAILKIHDDAALGRINPRKGQHLALPVPQLHVAGNLKQCSGIQTCHHGKHCTKNKNSRLFFHSNLFHNENQSRPFHCLLLHDCGTIIFFQLKGEDSSPKRFAHRERITFHLSPQFIKYEHIHIRTFSTPAELT